MNDDHVPIELSAETRRIVTDLLLSMRTDAPASAFATAQAVYEAHVSALSEEEASQAGMNVVVGLVTGDVDP